MRTPFIYNQDEFYQVRFSCKRCYLYSLRLSRGSRFPSKINSYTVIARAVGAVPCARPTLREPQGTGYIGSFSSFGVEAQALMRDCVENRGVPGNRSSPERRPDVLLTSGYRRRPGWPNSCDLKEVAK